MSENSKRTAERILSLVIAVIMCFGGVISAQAADTADTEEPLSDDVLIVVGGKSVTNSMTLDDVKALFGQPKLETASVFGGKACTFYNGEYEDYLYIETDSSGLVQCYGSISEGFRTKWYSYGQVDDNYVNGTRATHYVNGEKIIYGYIGYNSFPRNYYDVFFSDLYTYNKSLCRQSTLMFNAVSKLYGSGETLNFSEESFEYNQQLIDNGSNMYEYVANTSKDGYFNFSFISSLWNSTSKVNPLTFAETAARYSIGACTDAVFSLYNQGSSRFYVSGYINPKLFDKNRKTVDYTAEEKARLARMRSLYAESIQKWNDNCDSYYEQEPSFESLPITEGAINPNILQAATDYLNVARIGAGLPELELSQELSQGAQRKAAYTRYLALNDIDNPSPHFPPKVDGISDEFYDSCQSGSGENLFWGNALTSIQKALDDGYGDPIKGGHRHNLLDPEFQYFGIGSSSSGSMDSQGVHKFSGYVQSDKKLVCWPSDGVTVTNSLYRTSSFNWTIKLCDSDYTFTDDTTITVELLNTGDVWTFDKDTPNTDNCNYYRFKNLLSFYNSEMPLSKGNVFKVTVGNITNEETGELSEYSYRSVIETLSTYEGLSVTDIELDKDSAQMNVGEKIKLNARLTPYAPDNAMVYWQSSDESIATVSPNGFVTAKKGGNAVITAVSEDGSFAASCTVTVTTMLIGDVNDDKKINLFDAVLVNKQSLGYGSFTGAQAAAADVNSDSIVNLLDAIYIQKYVIGIPVDVPINTPLE